MTSLGLMLRRITKDLMKVLNIEKQEGEKVADFENRLKEEIKKLLNV